METTANGSRSAASRNVIHADNGAVTPPFWQRQRADSTVSVQRIPTAPITLEDHTEVPSDQSRSLWAKKVTIDDYILVSGNQSGIGAYVVYICNVETLDGAPITIRKRYSEFDALRRKLLDAFPHSRAAMPELPPKTILWRSERSFLEKRRASLCYFLNCVLLNPEFSAAPMLKNFVFA